MTETFSFSPIGIVRSPYREKFTIPRQPNLARVDAVVELLPPFAQPDTVSGLDQFSHIWITFIFHALSNKNNGERDWKALVRPPRLGGNERIGVFATRSTHRPNPVGLSVVELVTVEIDAGVRLHIRGADLLDGTPILDIKPYIPYADSIPDARAGFAQLAPPRLRVRWRNEALIEAKKFSEKLKFIVDEVLSFDPRPAYQNEPERIYGAHIADCNVRFRIDDGEVVVIEITRYRNESGRD